VTRFSDYVESAGCTYGAQDALQGVVNQYGAFALTSALRALDVQDTNVTALGACLAETTSSESIAQPLPEQTVP